MNDGGEEDSTANCGERRRRMIEMSGATSNLIANSVSSADASSSVPEPTSCADAEAVPVCGSMSVAGRMRRMEDAITIRTNMCRPEVNRLLPVHFFGVYDGHGGPHVASYCREKMHLFMTEELMLGGSGQGLEAAEDWWQLAMKRCFKRMDEVALSTCACGNIGYDCGRHLTAEMGLVGSTAVVAVITSEHLVVGNCGDSRAVLCRAGRVVPLSVDQKPDRADEFARIESLGGRVIFLMEHELKESWPCPGQ